jgi:hypothetical protein
VAGSVCDERSRIVLANLERADAAFEWGIAEAATPQEATEADDLCGGFAALTVAIGIVPGLIVANAYIAQSLYQVAHRVTNHMAPPTMPAKAPTIANPANP